MLSPINTSTPDSTHLVGMKLSATPTPGKENIPGVERLPASGSCSDFLKKPFTSPTRPTEGPAKGDTLATKGGHIRSCSDPFRSGRRLEGIAANRKLFILNYIHQ